MGFAALGITPARGRGRCGARARNDLRVTSRSDYAKTVRKCHAFHLACWGAPAAGNIFGRKILRQRHFPVSASCRDLQAGSLCSPETPETPAPFKPVPRYFPNHVGGLETAAPCSCNAGSRSRSRNSQIICLTNPASDRGKMKEYFGALPVAGEITRLSNRNRGS